MSRFMTQNHSQQDTAAALHLANRDITTRLKAGADPERVREYWKNAIDEIVNTNVESGHGVSYIIADRASIAAED